MRTNNFCARGAASAVALVLLLAGTSGCGNTGSAPDGPPGPDLTTPQGTLVAMTDYYGFRMADEMIGLLAPDYRFYPAEPESIPFLGPGETFWDRTQEVAILEELLDEEQTNWIDQVLLEAQRERTSFNPDSTSAEIESVVELLLLIGADSFEKAESRIVMTFQRDESGNYLLLEERESLSRDDDGTPLTQLTVGEHKAAVLEGP